MATLLTTGFENGVDPAGAECDGVTNAGQCVIDSTHFLTGSRSLTVTATASTSYVSKTVSNSVVTLTSAVYVTAYPTNTPPIIRGFVSSTSRFQASLTATGLITVVTAWASTNSTSFTSNTHLSLNTWYYLNLRFDSSATTWLLDGDIRDSTGRLLETFTQISFPGQPAATLMTQLRFGFDAGNASPGVINFDSVTATDQAADYPLTTAALPTLYNQNPLGVTGGVLFGQNNPNNSAGADATELVTAETSAKANRKIWVTNISYTPVAAPSNAQIAAIGSMMDGTLLNHRVIPVICGFGFDSLTTGWPAGGLADFTSGAMDATLQAWCDQLNKLPPAPYLFRLWREMNLTGNIYGTNGGAHGGVNESPATFIPAFQYVSTFLRARCSNMQIVWCPSVNQGAALNTLTPWYPGDAYVDWNGCDAYPGTGSTAMTTLLSNLSPFYVGYGPTGSYSRKPIILCETQTVAADASRITHVQAYPTVASTYPGFGVIHFWDTTSGGTYEITDTPSGFLSAYQSVISSAPFLGQPLPTFNIYQIGTGKDLVVRAA